MKKTIILLGLLLTTAGTTQAQTKFTPLDFNNTTSVNVATTSTSAPTPIVTTTSSATIAADTSAKGTDMLDPSQVTGGQKMQGAILQIDNAQVEVRNKLLNYKNSYAEVDARYNTIKTQRKALKKQIKLAEKKIKNLDRAKSKIQKNFQRNANV